MKQISLLREETFEGEDCFVVRGFHPFGFPIDLWISKNDYLLRKEREHNDDGTFQEEIRRNVKLNEPIPEELFHYTPPKKGLGSLGWLIPYALVFILVGFSILRLRRSRSRA